jgi:hypothetical protein
MWRENIKVDRTIEEYHVFKELIEFGKSGILVVRKEKCPLAGLTISKCGNCQLTQPRRRMI